MFPDDGGEELGFQVTKEMVLSNGGIILSELKDGMIICVKTGQYANIFALSSIAGTDLYQGYLTYGITLVEEEVAKLVDIFRNSPNTILPITSAAPPGRN